MTTITGPNIRIAQLLVVKQAIKLEALGMKHSGGSVRARWAAQLGLTSRTPHAKFIDKLEQRIAELRAAA